jgi:hypothetical protein
MPDCAIPCEVPWNLPLYQKPPKICFATAGVQSGRPPVDMEREIDAPLWEACADQNHLVDNTDLHLHQPWPSQMDAQSADQDYACLLVVGLRRDSSRQMPGGLGACPMVVASRWPRGVGSQWHGLGPEDAMATVEPGGQLMPLVRTSLSGRKSHDPILHVIHPLCTGKWQQHLVLD